MQARGTDPGQGSFEGEHDPRKLTARGHLAQGMGPLAGIEGDDELYPIGTLWSESTSGLFELNAELGDPEFQILELGTHGTGEFACHGLASFGEFPRAAGNL